MARSQSDLRAARRAAREAAKGRRQLPKSITARARKAPMEYAYRVLNGLEPRPAKGTLEGMNLARWGSYARWGKADPRFLAAFKDYFYHEQNGHV